MSKEEKLRSGVLAALQSHTIFWTARAFAKAFTLQASSLKTENLENDGLSRLARRRLETFGRGCACLCNRP
jgi:hypothetical protein